MATFSDIATSLRVTTMLPLDHKRFYPNELILSNLGIDNNLAFTYYDHLKVFCWAEKSEWVWREVVAGDTTQKLLASDFTYPNGAAYPPNPSYDGKKYNFHKLIEGADTKLVAGANITITGNGNVATPYVINSTATYTPPTSDIPPLQKINEGPGDGIIIRGRDATKYGPVGDRAFDISYSTLLASSSQGATGRLSFAQGELVISSAPYSVTFGLACVNSGENSFVNGVNITCGSRDSTVFGYGNASTGKGNTVLGIGNTVNGSGVVVLGNAANIISSSLSDYNSSLTKPVLVVGNGVIDNTALTVTSRSDAFIVRYNGILEAPNMTIVGITTGIGRTLVTKEYLATQIVTTSYKSYVATITQTGTNAPVAVILHNDFIPAPIWNYGSAGVYSLQLSGAWVNNKTALYISTTSQFSDFSISKIDSNFISVGSTNSAGVPTNGMLNGNTVEVRVYN